MYRTLGEHPAFRAIFNRAADAIFVADDGGRYVLANPAAAALTGHTAEALCTMSVFDLTPSASKEQGHAMWQQFIRQGSLSGEYVLTRTDGAEIEVEFQAVANIWPGAHLSILRDVTARKRDERLLRRAVSLHDATTAMSAAVDEEYVAQAILSAGLTALDAKAGCVFAMVDDGHWAELVASAGLTPAHIGGWVADFQARNHAIRSVRGRYQFSLDAPTLLTRIYQKGEPVRLDQLSELEPPDAQSRLADIGSAVVCLPLVVHDKLLGGLYLFWQDKRELSGDEAAFASTLGGVCAQALERVRLFAAEREAHAKVVASARSIREYQAKLQEMAFDNVVAEERERRRLASALHDGVTQYLALAKITLGPLRRQLGEAERDTLEAGLRLITDAIEATRSLTFELSPPMLYELGVRAALSWLGETLAQRTGLDIEVLHEGEVPPVDDVTASIVFRTVRELLVNVAKHANSSSARVYLRPRDEQLEVVVEDNGVGFDPGSEGAQAGFGLMSIREEIGRLGGSVDVSAPPGGGTCVCVRVPGRKPAG